MYSKIKPVISHALRTNRQYDKILINQGRVLSRLNEGCSFDDLTKYEFKIFSQWGEDGILQHLTNSLAIEHRMFIEFGVEDFLESNCRFLMMKDHWQGYIIDGSPKMIERIKASYFSWMFGLKSKCSFITAENICDLLEESGFPKNLGILSIDIDGVDYHIFNALSAWNPAIYVFEYNSLFGSQHPVTVEYDPSFTRYAKHYSNQFFGASLPAFDFLSRQRGYSLVGVNSAGSNAFYVRNDLLNDRVKPVSVADCFRYACFQESVDRNGKLVFQDRHERLSVIADMQVLNVETQKLMRVGDLDG